MMNKTIVSVYIVFLVCLTPARAQQGQPTDHVYYPGFVGVSTPLSIFAKPELKDACLSLQNGNAAIADAAFSQEIKIDPDDLSAYVGYLQSIRDRRDGLYLSYLHQAEYSTRPENNFRFGVLAFYMSGERFETPGKSAESMFLGKLARQYLQRSYDLSHDPITGFMLVSSMPYTGGGDDASIYEGMLHRLGGDKIYTAYLAAKSAHWAAPQPPVPHLSPNHMLIFRWVVGCLWTTHSWLHYEPHTVDGKIVYQADESDYTPDQKSAMAYLDEWRIRLRHASGEN